MASFEEPSTGVNLERELVCFICTEVLFQPLTLIDCLHSFCGACLKQWFSHQHQKASSSHPSTSNPYTCPTCRAVVKDARPMAMVNTTLDMFLTANPSRVRTREDREEYSAIYTPGENILPRSDGGRRRERRTRRDDEEARDRRMVEEARERSLRETHADPAPSQNTLHIPASGRQDQSSRSHDREREERRERRREQARREQRQRAHDLENTPPVQSEASIYQEADHSPAVPPTSSPRHPEAVEARQRQQTVAHQASLVSLISSSEGTSSTGTGESINEAEVLQEIVAAGLLDGIDVDSLTEAEQDALAERIAEAYRQKQRMDRHRNASAETHTTGHESNHLRVAPTSDDDRRRRRSGSRQRRADETRMSGREAPTTERHRNTSGQPTDSNTSLQPPQSIVTHRRRTSNQSQSGVSFSNTSRNSSPAVQASNAGTRSATNLGSSARPEDSGERRAAQPSVPRLNTDTRTSARGSDISLPGTTEVVRPPMSGGSSLNPTSPRQAYAELADTETRSSQLGSTVSSHLSGQSALHGLSHFDEPSVSCFRCHRADIQYEVYKHCFSCNVDLCIRCYRGGRGCNHWYGFGHAAMAKFEASTADQRDSEQVELPHILVGRSTTRPEQSMILSTKLAKDGRTAIPLTTRSDPSTRTQEGHFCDRCGAFANSCFWSCDYCNDGEWGFCRNCVNIHHCCTHPLLPIAHRSSVPSSQQQQSTPNPHPQSIDTMSNELHTTHLRPSSAVSQLSSATSAMSALAGPHPGYVHLNIPTSCDHCSQPIAQSHTRYHCPSHSSPTHSDAAATGDYDICVSCYHGLVKTNRIKRDDGPAGWRKCLSGHRMIVTTFETDADGQYRRVVLNDLVGGWKLTDQAMSAWMMSILQRRDMQSSSEPPSSMTTSPLDDTANPIGTWTWREDASTSRRATRARTLTISPISSPHQSYSGPSGSAVSSPTSTSTHSKFPPDGGFGASGIALWSYYPDEGDDGRGELLFPRGAEIREIEDINGEWWEGVYAGDVGVGPGAYVRL